MSETLKHNNRQIAINRWQELLRQGRAKDADRLLAIINRRNLQSQWIPAVGNTKAEVLWKPEDRNLI